MAVEDHGFAYRRGTLDDRSISQVGGMYRVTIDGRMWPEEFNTVVVRHGPQQAVSRIEGLKVVTSYSSGLDSIFANKKQWSTGFFSKIATICGPTSELIRNEFESRVDDFKSLQDATKFRLLGDAKCEQLLFHIVNAGREHLGFAEFELALYHFGRQEYQASLNMAERASSHLPHIFRWTADSFASFLKAAQAVPGSTIPILEMKVVESDLNRFAHGFATYTSLQRGWAHLIGGDFQKANQAWRLVNQRVSYADILVGYPFVSHTLALDQLIIDLVADPRLSELERLRVWIETHYQKAVQRLGFEGHHQVMRSTVELLMKSDSALENLRKLGETWPNPHNKPSVENIRKRFELFLNAH